jgi:PAS domain S-box-containing protein
LDLLVDELNQMRLSLGASFSTLRKSESRYRELYDTMAQGVIYRDDKGMITSANNAAEEILGLSIEQMLGRNDVNRVWKAIRENGEPIADAEFPTASALRTGKGVDNLVMGFYHPREQQYRWALVSSKTAQAADNDGKKLAFSTFTDITERRRAAIEREHLIRELENKNAELERFVYTISHELKTPLVTIAGYSGILMDEVDGGERLVLEDHVGQINAAIATMSTLLDELLELSRIGRVIYPQECFAFGDMVQEVALTVQSRAEKHQATIDVAADLPLVYGDRVRLREVMQNLVENAIKFSQKPVKPRIHVGWRQQAGEKVFFVEDNGIGVDPSYQLRIFGLFERLDPKTEGTGVGLALVQRIIQEHGGRVWVESEGIGQGSRFCFTIPSGKND